MPAHFKRKTSKAQFPIRGIIPQGMSQQVIQILTDAGRPLKPKDIVNRHIELGWTETGMTRAKLYEAVSGSLSYLLNRKGVLTKSKKGYSTKQDGPN